MLHIILKIIIGVLLFFAILYLVLTLLCLISSKDYRKWFWEESVRRAKEDEQKRTARKILERQRFDKYYKTGNSRYLYDDDFEGLLDFSLLYLQINVLLLVYNPLVTRLFI